MATLTADGINCSNGTLNGFYTGSTANNTSYPLGSLLSGAFDGCSQTFYLNQAYTLYVQNNAFARYPATYNTGVALAGTWRVRGAPGGILQRVS